MCYSRALQLTCESSAQVQSTMGTQPLKAVAEAAGSAAPCLWFQLYVLSDRAFVRKLVQGTLALRVHSGQCKC